jgi:L-lactate dehydrogenase (cytochrome)
MDMMNRWPALSDLHAPARRRIPRIAWEYLDSGVGAEQALMRNRDALAAIALTPRFLGGVPAPDISTTLFGRVRTLPIGTGPIGMSSLIWPGSELMLARAAHDAGGIYCLSTVAGESIEAVGDAAPGSWFQLYTPNDPAMRRDLITRAKAAKFEALIVTIDVPVASRRERQRRAGVGMPPKIGPSMIADFLMHPAWLLATLRRGAPTFENLKRYATPEELSNISVFVTARLSHGVTPDLLAEIRRDWDGPLLVKGVLDPAEAEVALAAGVDGIIVSNHGGRQLDLAPAAIDMLPRVAETVAGRAAVLMDSGLRSGADIARALALGADAALLGRPFLWACAAGGDAGARHAFDVLADDLRNVMHQLGCARPGDLAARLTEKRAS